MEEKERLSFEAALLNLQSVVEELEADEVTLKRSIFLYEEGIKLSNLCTSILEDAKLRIEKVNKQNG